MDAVMEIYIPKKEEDLSLEFQRALAGIPRALTDIELKELKLHLNKNSNFHRVENKVISF